MGWSVRWATWVLVAALGAAAATSSAADTPSASTPAITLLASADQVSSGGSVTLSGQLAGAGAGTTVDLEQLPYPYTASHPDGSTATGATGSFSFTVSPQVDARYRVVVPGTTDQASVQIDVTDRIVIRVRALRLGRAAIRVLVYHPSELHWGRVPVHWWFGTRFRGRLHAAPATRTRRLNPNLIALYTSITLPAGYFRWRACFYARDDQALVNREGPPGCSGRGYHGIGHLPYGYPGPHAVDRAAAYLASRNGRTAFGVMDSEGRLSGVHVHWTFVSASVVKAMLLVAYLRRLDGMGQHYVDSYSNSFLYPMINVSDNNAATQTWSIVGNGGLYALAHAAGMTDYSVTTDWASSQISPADQAKFFFEMDSLIPREFVGYASNLLSTIAGFESWGIPAVARPLGYQVFFKGGWRPTVLGQLVHQIGRLEGHGKVFSIAVMTDGDPSMGYGIDTIQGVTAALLSTPPPRHIGRLDPRALAGGG